MLEIIFKFCFEPIVIKIVHEEAVLAAATEQLTQNIELIKKTNETLGAATETLNRVAPDSEPPKE